VFSYYTGEAGRRAGGTATYTEAHTYGTILVQRILTEQYLYR